MLPMPDIARLILADERLDFVGVVKILRLTLV